MIKKGGGRVSVRRTLFVFWFFCDVWRLPRKSQKYLIGVVVTFHNLWKKQYGSFLRFKLIILNIEHACRGEFGLAQKCAFIKKFTIFTQFLRNFVKIRYSYVPHFDKVSLWLGKNCEFFNKSIFLVESAFSYPSL